MCALKSPFCVPERCAAAHAAALITIDATAPLRVRAKLLADGDVGENIPRGEGGRTAHRHDPDAPLRAPHAQHAHGWGDASHRGRPTKVPRARAAQVVEQDRPASARLRWHAQVCSSHHDLRKGSRRALRRACRPQDVPRHRCALWWVALRFCFCGHMDAGFILGEDGIKLDHRRHLHGYSPVSCVSLTCSSYRALRVRVLHGCVCVCACLCVCAARGPDQKYAQISILITVYCIYTYTHSRTKRQERSVSFRFPTPTRSQLFGRLRFYS